MIQFCQQINCREKTDKEVEHPVKRDMTLYSLIWILIWTAVNKHKTVGEDSILIIYWMIYFRCANVIIMLFNEILPFKTTPKYLQKKYNFSHLLQNYEGREMGPDKGRLPLNGQVLKLDNGFMGSHSIFLILCLFIIQNMQLIHNRMLKKYLKGQNVSVLSIWPSICQIVASISNELQPPLNCAFTPEH